MIGLFFRELERFAIALLLGSGFCASLQAAIHYQVSLGHPEQHLFHVTMTIPDVADQVVVRIPAWNALYQIRDFSAHIQQVRVQQGESAPGDVSANAGAAAIEKIDKQTWRVSGHGTVVLRYASYWDEPGPFATQLNQEHAFLNPAMILMYAADRQSEAVDLQLLDLPDRWQAAGAGMEIPGTMGGAGKLRSTFANYDALVDAPIEAGKFEEFRLQGVTPEIWVVVHGDKWNKKEMESELKRICEYEIKLMEGAPYPRYTFIVHTGKAAAGAGGGMEHANSTAIAVPSGEYLSTTAAHEFFHLWNVKRIRPASLYPVDYSQEQYTRALWFAEGVTDTYAAYTMERSGLWTRQHFYQDLGTQISELEERPANHWQSAEESSLDAWLEKYDLYNGPQYSVSYYTKGQVLGVLLDILIRDRTENEKSLDDVLRAMNREFALAGKTYRDSLDVQRSAEKIASGSLEDFFRRYVAGAEPLPYRETLALAGLQLRESVRRRATLGFSPELTSEGMLLIRSVDVNGPAAAVLRPGDLIVRWNGAEPPRRPADWLRQHHSGEELHLRIRREQAELNVDFRVGEIIETFYDVAEDPHAGEKARHLRDGWLRGITDQATMHAAK